MYQENERHNNKFKYKLQPIQFRVISPDLQLHHMSVNFQRRTEFQIQIRQHIQALQ